MGWREFLDYCFPHYHYNSVSEIPFGEFQRMGYRGIIFDVDDTLTRHHGTQIHPKAQQGLELATELGFEMCALTNCTQKRGQEVRNFLEMGVIVPKRMKPSRQGFEEAVAYLGLPKEQVLMIGNRILTDIYGASRCDLTTVLVNPISESLIKNSEIWLYKALKSFLVELTSCNQSF